MGMRIVIMGNSGSGKTSMARRLGAAGGIACLCLDDIAWYAGVSRRPIDQSLADLQRFITEHPRWIIEGCYGELIEAALPFADELHFLNPGIEFCVQNCRNRPWEPQKFASPQEQQQMLKALIAWVGQYETRTDEFGLARHLRIYEQFTRPKRQYSASDLRTMAG
mgnify:CR=1 FL=1